MKHSLEIATKALALCAGAFLFGGQVWAKDEPVVLAQSEKWVANFDTDFCALTTAFGSDDSKIFVRLTRFQPDDPFILELFGKALKSNDPRSKIKIAFGPNGNVVEIQTTNGTNGKLPMMVLGYQDLLNRKSIPNQFRPPISPDQEAAVSTLDVAVPGRKPLRLMLESMGKSMQVMRACTSGLVQSWGYDADQQAKLSRPAAAIGSPGNWIGTNDYPQNMVHSGGQGFVQFRLDVEATGAISGCRVLQRTNPDEFADLTCRLILKRARMSPAMDFEGKPVKSYYVNRVQWIMED